MRAVVADVLGAPETANIREVDRPLLKDGHVRIKVHYAGVSFVTALVAAGHYQVKPALPFIPGDEFSGLVTELSSAASGLSVGDRVFATGFGGAFAEEAVVPATQVHRIPDRMSLCQAAIFRGAYTSAYHALVQCGRLASEEILVVLGAGGSSGLAAIEVGRALGARVIGSASSEIKRARALAAGAELVLEGDAPDWRYQLKAATQGHGADVVFDPVGGDATERAFRSLAWNGRHLVFGFAAGAIPRLPTNLALLKGASLIGVDKRQFAARDPLQAQANTETLFSLFENGKLTASVDRELPFAQFADALTLVREGGEAGRIVLRILDSTP